MTGCRKTLTQQQQQHPAAAATPAPAAAPAAAPAPGWSPLVGVPFHPHEAGKAPAAAPFGQQIGPAAAPGFGAPPAPGWSPLVGVPFHPHEAGKAPAAAPFGQQIGPAAGRGFGEPPAAGPGFPPGPAAPPPPEPRPWSETPAAPFGQQRRPAPRDWRGRPWYGGAKSSENELLSEKIEDKNISDLISTKPAKIKKQMSTQNQRRKLMDEIVGNRLEHPLPFSTSLLSINDKLNKEYGKGNMDFEWLGSLYFYNVGPSNPGIDLTQLKKSDWEEGVKRGYLLSEFVLWLSEKYNVPPPWKDTKYEILFDNVSLKGDKTTEKLPVTTTDVVKTMAPKLPDLLKTKMTQSIPTTSETGALAAAAAAAAGGGRKKQDKKKQDKKKQSKKKQSKKKQSKKKQSKKKQTKKQTKKEHKKKSRSKKIKSKKKYTRKKY